jgi:hypothetical protein
MGGKEVLAEHSLVYARVQVGLQVGWLLEWAGCCCSSLQQMRSGKHHFLRIKRRTIQ